MVAETLGTQGGASDFEERASNASDSRSKTYGKRRATTLKLKSPGASLDRDAFGKIPRLIHIATKFHGDVIGEELKDDRCQDRG